MSRTRKYVERRRKVTHRRRRAMKGGGKLNRLPVGPGSRDAAGNPIQIELPQAAAGGAGGPAADPRFVYLGSSEALDKGRANALSKVQNLLNNDSMPSAKRIVEIVSTLPSNLKHTYIDPAKYSEIFKNYANDDSKVKDKYAMALSSVDAHDHESYNLPDMRERKSIIDEVDHDFKTNWDFKYVCGHGVLKPELPTAVVPPRTYIRFHSPAGSVATVSMTETGMIPIMAYPGIFTKGSKEAFVKEMVGSYFFNKGPLESFSSQAERNALIANPYPPKFCSDPNNPLTESPACLAPEYQKQTIYMPGENIPEMSIAFKNNPYETFIIGVYNLPISYEFYTAVQHTSENKAKSATKVLSKMTDAELRAAIASQDRLDKYLFTQRRFEIKDEKGHTVYINNENLIPALIGRTVVLSELLANLPPVEDGKVRFLYINSCRGAPRVMNDTGMRANVLGAWGAGGSAAAAGGAGAPAAPAPKIQLNIAQRKALAMKARRYSLGDPIAIKDQPLLQQCIEARTYMRTHPISDPERARKAEIDSKIMGTRPDIWGIAVSLVPVTDPIT